MNGPCFIRYQVCAIGQYVGKQFDDYDDAFALMRKTLATQGNAGIYAVLYMRNGNSERELTRRIIFSADERSGAPSGGSNA